jgi:hypothetical protein
MKIIELLDGTTIPYSKQKFKELYPNVGLPPNPTDEQLEQFGVYTCSITDRPSINTLSQKLEEKIEKIDGQWVKNWTIINLSIEEIEQKINQIKKNLHSKRKSTRIKQETNGFIFNGHPIASDDKSIMRIQSALGSAIVASMNSIPFNVVWLCEDEYEMSMNAEEFLSFHQQMVTIGQQIHNRSQELKTLIEGINETTDIDNIENEIQIGWTNNGSP